MGRQLASDRGRIADDRGVMSTVQSPAVNDRTPSEQHQQSAQSPGGDWTTRKLLAWMNEHFTKRDVDSPRLVAELLLCHVLGCERMRLYMEVDRQATEAERQQLRELVARASSHEPVQYLVGEGWFFSRPFEVNRSTLIPRPSTETLVERVLGWCREQVRVIEELDGKNVVRGDESEGDGGETGAESHGQETVSFEKKDEAAPSIELGSGAAVVSEERLRIADVGTGTGCIAISLAAQLPNGVFLATDVSEDALELAGRNAQRHGVGKQIAFAHGDLLGPVRNWIGDAKLDVLCSNPPYVPDEQWADVEPNVKDHEPEGALRGGADGLDCIRSLIEGAGDVLRPGGLLAIEIANVHRQAVLELIEQAGVFQHAEVVRDHEGHDRVLLAVLK